jgi:hypothetical protein
MFAPKQKHFDGTDYSQHPSVKDVFKRDNPPAPEKAPELLPCPFCGGEPSVRYNEYSSGKDFFAECDNPGCNVRPVTMAWESEEVLAEHWNKRPPAPAPSELNAAENLLAVIHRDGGHYTKEHGFEKSCADAEKIVLRDRRDEPSERERELEKVLREIIQKAPEKGPLWFGSEEMKAARRAIEREVTE